MQDAGDYERIGHEYDNDREKHDDEDVGHGYEEVGVLVVALDVTELDMHASRSLREIVNLKHEGHLFRWVQNNDYSEISRTHHS